MIVFSPLTTDEVGRIARIQLDKLAATVLARGKQLEIAPAAIEQLVREGHSLAYGARFLKRVIDDRVKIPLSEIWGTGERFRVDAADGAITVTAVTAAAAEETRRLAAV